MFPIKTVQDYMYPQKLRGELDEQKQRARLYGQQAQWYGPKSQSEIDLINQGQIPHYQALNDLIRQGQIPHYMAQNALMYQGQIPHLQAQSGLLGEQAQEQGYKNKFVGSQWKQWRKLQDEIDALNDQGSPHQLNQTLGDEYFTPEINQQIEEANRIVDLRNGGKNVRQAVNEPTLNSALNPSTQQQVQPNTGNSPPPQVLGEMLNQINQQTNPQQQAAPQQLGEAQQQFEPSAQLSNKEQRIAQLREAQQSLLGNLGKAGVAGTETPLSKEERAEKLAEKREDIKTYSQGLKSANETARDATQMKSLINQFQSAYSKIENKGPVLGRLPAVTSEQQIADNAAQNMQQMMVKLMKTNRMTNYELQFAGNLKLNRAMNPETVKDVGNFLKAKSERLTEEPKFINAAKNKGIRAEDAKVLWNEYENDKPVYNFETRSINKNNLNSYADYLTPEALNKAINPSMQANAQTPEMVQVIAPNGQVGNIPRDKLDEALKRGARVSQ